MTEVDPRAEGVFLSLAFQVRNFCIFVSKPSSASDDQLFKELLESITAKISF